MMEAIKNKKVTIGFIIVVLTSLYNIYSYYSTEKKAEVSWHRWASGFQRGFIVDQTPSYIQFYWKQTPKMPSCSFTELWFVSKNHQQPIVLRSFDKIHGTFAIRHDNTDYSSGFEGRGAKVFIDQLDIDTLYTVSMHYTYEKCTGIDFIKYYTGVLPEVWKADQVHIIKVGDKIHLNQKQIKQKLIERLPREMDYQYLYEELNN